MFSTTNKSEFKDDEIHPSRIYRGNKKHGGVGDYELFRNFEDIIYKLKLESISDGQANVLLRERCKSKNLQFPSLRYLKSLAKSNKTGRPKWLANNSRSIFITK